jgi:hypothetical protein
LNNLYESLNLIVKNGVETQINSHLKIKKYKIFCYTIARNNYVQCTLAVKMTMYIKLKQVLKKEVG